MQPQTQQRYSKPQARRVTGLEHRYRRAVAIARSCKTNRNTKSLECDIAHVIDTIDRYGFEFFPNHFIRDEVIKFEAMVNQLQFATTAQ